MKNSSGPVRQFPLAEQALEDFRTARPTEVPDFRDTVSTFRHLSDARLLGTRRLFRLMGNRWLTRIMGSLGLRAVEYNLPGAEWMVKNTVYQQFVGGVSLEEAIPVIEILAERGVDSILDFGAEGKATERGRDDALEESLRAVEFAASTDSVIGAVVKLTSIIPFELLEQLNDTTIDFENITDDKLKKGLERLDRICRLGRERGSEVYIDAEESWIQHSIDQICERMMSRYNCEKHTVFTTCQMYRHDRLDFLKTSHLRARQDGYKLALKVVRGAYMVKERKRAEATGKPSPIQPTIEATHRDYDAAIAYCVEHHDEIACCLASHNEASTVKLIRAMQEKGIRCDHPNLRFSQLLGMSGNLTFNLAEAGYNVSKYMVYGPVKDVFPYLLRRAQENTSVTGESGRELSMLDQEVRRRGL
ncbi:proline dehydrogenase family protein [Lewinella sp. JB7]|uniref:proline dehydrogenase family protein n=1 Tax=Lewinella sp. JB7 TaxID=2962887 RepID=UPI0020C9735A|nr:proline dehydrogenase family protein [Lewinella sp. JB7]MCP9235315.1 proline dehydrogenase family protein [Lewinella sp. JB7]